MALSGRGGQTGGMISIDDYLAFAEEALGDMVTMVGDLGDERANRRPHIADANTPYAILTHCLGVMEFWGGHIVAGRAVERDRAAEFRAVGRVDELIGRAGRAREQLRADVANVDPFAPPRGTLRSGDADLPLGRTQGGALMHVYEELAQHRGHMEITRDLLLASAPESSSATSAAGKQ